MIKLLKKYEIHTTPFEAIKNWAINNTHNDNLLLYESTGSDDGLPYALEYVDYGSSGHPVVNSLCDIALEQQDADLATLELGVNVVGIFYPELDPKNIDGTYMRSVYHQIKTMFYNQYYDPTKVWGIENIDFPLSKTERRMSDEIRLIDIPRLVFGDKIVPKSVVALDNTTDNEYIITDDGYGNLRAGINLFSHQQEIRHHRNEFDIGYSYFCDPYFNFSPATPINLSASLVLYHTGHLTWETGSDSPVVEDGFIIQARDVTLAAPYATVGVVGTGVLTFDYWPIYSQHTFSFRVASFSGPTFSNFSNEVSLTAPPDPIITLQPLDQTQIEGLTASFSSSAGLSAPFTYQWVSGSANLVDGPRITGSLTPELLINNIQPSDTGSYALHVTNLWGNVYSNPAYLTIISNIVPVYVNDSSSMNVSLLFGSIAQNPPIPESTVPGINLTLITGSVLTVVITMSAPPETSSVNAGFYAGSIFDVIKVVYGGNETASVNAGFYAGNIFNVLVPIYGGNETASVSTGFYSGYTTLEVITDTEQDAIEGMTITLISGSVSGSSP